MEISLARAILNQLESTPVVALLLVLHHQGSSPGRTGFMMSVCPEQMHGSVGGGILEHKFVELARERLKSRDYSPLVKLQIHRAEAGKDRSGMICSGEQIMGLIFLDQNARDLLQKVENLKVQGISISPEGICETETPDQNHLWKQYDENRWEFICKPGFRRKILIVGGGHVSLALSRLAADLGYYVHVVDHRPGLNTLKSNIFAHKKEVIEYSALSQLVPHSSDWYIILMTFGYRTDGEAIRHLRGKKCAYLGMMGAQAKINTMWEELRQEGWTESELQAIDAPAGLPIGSQTSQEIAISILAKWILLEKGLNRR